MKSSGRRLKSAKSCFRSCFLFSHFYLPSMQINSSPLVFPLGSMQKFDLRVNQASTNPRDAGEERVNNFKLSDVLMENLRQGMYSELSLFFSLFDTKSSHGLNREYRILGNQYLGIFMYISWVNSSRNIYL